MDSLLSQSGRPWIKVDGHSTKSGRSFGINRSVKLDGPSVKLDASKVSNWTARKFQTGRSESIKLDGSKVFKLFRTVSAI